ncbi:Transcription initiation factor TFIID subunit 10 [Phytophthora boehmeriae]|uniref:Transcription initiation factor TFIID subunit 10 n=1 Tax=Phytophthora boehmeriae TaxID=109152 RepID=A0A8T1WPM1_9STRA|nr:Transcription initiation factor TFIID subunit 10 [Phytophthora boehmeriae]
MEETPQLSAFLEAMTQFSPTVPEELVEFYLQQAGFATNDVRVTRMVSLVAHKLLLDVTHDAMQYQRIRSQAAASTADGVSPSASRSVLTMEDLAASLKEYGVNICRPEYVSDVAQDPTE